MADGDAPPGFRTAGSLLGRCRSAELRAPLQDNRRALSGAAAGVRHARPAHARDHRCGSVHGVGHPGLPLGGRRAVRPHRPEAHAACGVRPQRAVPPAVLGQKLSGVAAVLLPPAEPGAQSAAAMGGGGEAALAGHAERGRASRQSGTETADGAARLRAQVRHDPLQEVYFGDQCACAHKL